MGGISLIKDKVMNVVDFIMPPLDEEEELGSEISAAGEKAAGVHSARTASASVNCFSEDLKVSNGGTIHVERPSAAPSYSRQSKSRPQFTVHTMKQPALKVQIYAPRNFDQVTAIADDLKAGKACVVNYEKVETEEQRRICDFVNGVCYVLDGCAKRISAQIVLYVPEGVDVAEAMTVALTD
ncbi:cell division protein SepF [Selenomonas montiformis]|uniref:Cell division protein SepF n=1 Tax=Selenomonas montiformis TaxID=2652285 RepID=A0A6I2V0N1_9FIRM|nr:cell division protein SepF [Selenomonas montiformis]MDY4696756.1 cell division protein SepF [Selenomonas montiformis]MSV25900.1 cell division protein SepF [Selenomonas montiformis]